MKTINLDLEKNVVILFNAKWCEPGNEMERHLKHVANQQLEFTFYFIDLDINKDVEILVGDSKLALPDVIPSIIVKKDSKVTTKFGSLTNDELEELL